MQRVIKILTLLFFISTCFVLYPTKVAAIGKIYHKFYLQLPNGKQIELKGVKIHHSKLLSNDQLNRAGYPEYPRDDQTLVAHGILDECYTTGDDGYHCYNIDSCYAEDVGGPYIPPSYNSNNRFDNSKDSTYKNFTNETFLAAIEREAPYLVGMYDPTSIRGFQNARWQGRVDYSAGNGLVIISDAIGAPHSNYTQFTRDVRLNNTSSWDRVNGYGGSQSWGPGELYRNNVGGNIVHGKLTWTLIPPEEPPTEPPTAEFSGSCQQKSCPVKFEYKLRVHNITPTNITSQYTKAGFYISINSSLWNTEQRARIRSFLGEPDFSDGPSFGYMLTTSSDLRSDNGKPYVELALNGSQAIGKAGKTIDQLSAWTLAEKTANRALPQYFVAGNLTVDGGKTLNGYVGGVLLSFLPDECSSCGPGGGGGQPSGTFGGEVIACTVTAPQTQRFTVSNIDLKGNIFERVTISAKFIYNANTAKLIGTATQPGLLGQPQTSEWLSRGVIVPSNGEWFTYTLHTVTQYSGQGNISFVWDDSVNIGYSSKKLSDLITFAEANNLGSYVTVEAVIQTKTPAGILQQQEILGSVLTELKAACAGGGGVCPVSEQGPPNPPEILEPSNLDATISVNAQNEFTLTWRQLNATNGRGNVVDEYEILVYPSNTYATPDAASAAATGDVDNGIWPAANVIRHWQNVFSSNYSQLYSRLISVTPALGDRITIAIRSKNTRPISCMGSEYDAVNRSPWTTRPDMPLSAVFGGHFFKSASCNLATAEPITLNSNSFVQITTDPGGQQYTTPASGHDYLSEVSPGNFDYFPKLKLDTAGLSEALICSSCNPDRGDGMCDLGRVTELTQEANFFLESYNLNFPSWWQSRSGIVYGHTSLTSTLPLESGVPNGDCLAASGYCEPYIVRRDRSESELSGGVPMTFGAINDVGGWYTDRPEQTYADSGADGKSSVIRENYGYFAGKIEVPAQDISGNITSLGDIPAGTLTSGARVSFYNGNLTISPDQTWVVPNGEKRIIFIRGDLTISQVGETPVTKVEEGGFLAFIVSGTVTFDGSVGHENPDETTPNQSIETNVEGVFIADGQIIVSSRGANDKKFVAAGTYVGWTGVQLRRTFDNGGLGKVRNTTTPSETFIFRPDFATNTPDLFRFTELVWQEVN